MGVSGKSRGGPDLERRAYLIANLRRYEKLHELRNSGFFGACQTEIDTLLHRPEIHRHAAAAAPRIGGFVRVAAWNIEKGKQLARILEVLRSDPVLRSADVIILNEVDKGMARSANVDVACRVADALGMNLVFAAAHLELTKGTDQDLEVAAENRDSLQGNAVLTRYPVVEACGCALPSCFEPYEFHEKRYGARNCVWARLQVGDGTLWAGSAHFEVRNGPPCRARQMRSLLAQLPGRPGDAYLLAGDFNSNGFGRGTRSQTVRSVCRLLSRSQQKVSELLCHPERGGEPLFRRAHEAGFGWSGLNSFEPTACTPIGSLEDASFLPDSVVRFVKRRLEPYGGYLRFKLDWIVARGVIPLGDREARDTRSGECSRAPGCIATEYSGAGRISDHRPIFADIRVPAP